MNGAAIGVDVGGTFTDIVLEGRPYWCLMMVLIAVLALAPEIALVLPNAAMR
jgi:hypothetical protein